jgi:hypothetical protein
MMQQLLVSTKFTLPTRTGNFRKRAIRPYGELNSTLALEGKIRLGILRVFHNVAEISGLKYDTLDVYY